MFKAMLEFNTFYFYIKPLVRSLQILGLIPFYVAKNGLEESKLHLSWAILIMTAFTALSLYAILVREVQNIGFIMKAWDVLNVYTNLINMCATFACSLIFRKEVSNVK